MDAPCLCLQLYPQFCRLVLGTLLTGDRNAHTHTCEINWNTANNMRVQARNGDFRIAVNSSARVGENGSVYSHTVIIEMPAVPTDYPIEIDFVVFKSPLCSGRVDHVLYLLRPSGGFDCQGRFSFGVSVRPAHAVPVPWFVSHLAACLVQQLRLFFSN